MLRLTNKEPMPIPDPLKGEDNKEDSPLASVPVAQLTLTLTLTPTPTPTPNPTPTLTPNP